MMPIRWTTWTLWILHSVPTTTPWEEISDRPSGLDDGDDVGITSETDPTVLASVKDGVNWGELSGVPAGFADGVDNEGLTTETDPTVLVSVKDGVSWTEVTNKPSGFADGVDNEGVTTSSDYGRSGVATNLYEGTSTLAGKYVNATGDTMSGSTSSSVLSVSNFGAYGYGVQGYATGTNACGVYGFATAAYGHGVYGYASNLGDVINFGGYFKASGRSGRGVNGSASGAYGRGVNGSATNTGDVTNYGGYFSALGKYGTGLYARGGSSGWAGDFVGNVRIRNHSLATIMELGEGLDYAEGFDVSDLSTIDPGSVLIIDPNNPGKLTVSKMPYDTKVAGIAAGANGLGSGVRLGGDRFDQDVALAGRVYCNVDAIQVGVEPGDMLTTSSTPGHAMKSTDYARAHGAILGKAMQRLEKGQKGQILVLVTLQ